MKNDTLAHGNVLGREVRPLGLAPRVAAKTPFWDGAPARGWRRAGNPINIPHLRNPNGEGEIVKAPSIPASDETGLEVFQFWETAPKPRSDHGSRGHRWSNSEDDLIDRRQ